MLLKRSSFERAPPVIRSVKHEEGSSSVQRFFWEAERAYQTVKDYAIKRRLETPVVCADPSCYELELPPPPPPSASSVVGGPRKKSKFHSKQITCWTMEKWNRKSPPTFSFSPPFSALHADFIPFFLYFEGALFSSLNAMGVYFFVLVSTLRTTCI